MSSSDENVKQLDAQTLLEGKQYGIIILEKSGSFFKHCYTTQQSHWGIYPRNEDLEVSYSSLFFQDVYKKKFYYLYLPSQPSALFKKTFFNLL